jgi:hypothetical protein
MGKLSIGGIFPEDSGALTRALCAAFSTVDLMRLDLLRLMMNPS